METFGDTLSRVTERLRAADVFCGHGYESIHDEAVALILGAARLPQAQSYDLLAAPFPTGARRRLDGLLQGRCEERVPVAYLLGEAWLAGICFACDDRALVPRSPIAHLLKEGCRPWWPETAPPAIIIDLCCGGGSLGIIAAHAFPSAAVFLSDIDQRALALAQENIKRCLTEETVRCVQAHLLGSFATGCVDLIVANPPYVSGTEMGQLPPEYEHEPRGALQADEEGVALAVELLKDAARVLSDRGLLILEVGKSAEALEHRLPKVPFTWVDLPTGGSGVAAVSAQELRDWSAAGNL